MQDRAFSTIFWSDCRSSPITVAVALRAGSLNAQLQVRGICVAWADLLIGTTTLELGYQVATRNERHVAVIPGISLSSALASPQAAKLKPVPTLSFQEARDLVLNQLRRDGGLPASELVPLLAAHGRVLAQNITADRDLPPFHRSVRDGFAVRSADLPGSFTVIGEVAAGTVFQGTAGPRQAVEIMTGAPMPQGADCVVMVEHCQRADGKMTTDRILAPETHIAKRGGEAGKGDMLLTAGARLDYPAIALLAATGHSGVEVYRKPRVAILATGDEIVEVDQTPLDHQIRNSNAWSLAAQVERAGGEPIILPIAPDTEPATRALIETGLQADLLLLSGGVSAGKYDVVEPALKALDAEFFFDRVAIQPGQPVVFGCARNKFFFGLPGNPASTMVTFEIFARAAVEILGGATDSPLPMTLARLTRPFHHRPGLTRFLPAVVSGTEVTPVDWQGSGDVPSLCRANAFLVADPEKPDYVVGDLIPILFK
ncbi:MAG: molybdopterin molybdochelatase [Bryobacterales bacterium]|nr:molybdopterin molybdochelatase [Bryobacterales bacterium]